MQRPAIVLHGDAGKKKKGAEAAAAALYRRLSIKGRKLKVAWAAKKGGGGGAGAKGAKSGSTGGKKSKVPAVCPPVAAAPSRAQIAAGNKVSAVAAAAAGALPLPGAGGVALYGSMSGGR